ncbi:hypothetical protein GCM10020219_039280 [Nonomuraea dietziae]
MPGIWDCRGLWGCWKPLRSGDAETGAVLEGGEPGEVELPEERRCSGTISRGRAPEDVGSEERGSQAISEDRGLSQAQGLGAGTPEERDSGTQRPEGRKHRGRGAREERGSHETPVGRGLAGPGAEGARF